MGNRYFFIARMTARHLSQSDTELQIPALDEQIKILATMQLRPGRHKL